MEAKGQKDSDLTMMWKEERGLYNEIATVSQKLSRTKLQQEAVMTSNVSEMSSASGTW